MNEDSPLGLYRVGAPPAGPPPRRAYRRYLLAGVAVLALAAGAAIAGILVARSDTSPAAAPSSSASPLGEAETCLRLIPLLTDVVREVTAVTQEPDRDNGDLAATAALLRRVEAVAPQEWRLDIATQHGVLQQLIDAHGDHGRIAAVDYDAFYESALRLTGGCKPYAI